MLRMWLLFTVSAGLVLLLVINSLAPRKHQEPIIVFDNSRFSARTVQEIESNGLRVAAGTEITVDACFTTGLCRANVGGTTILIPWTSATRTYDGKILDLREAYLRSWRKLLKAKISTPWLETLNKLTNDISHRFEIPSVAREDLLPAIVIGKDSDVETGQEYIISDGQNASIYSAIGGERIENGPAAFKSATVSTGYGNIGGDAWQNRILIEVETASPSVGIHLVQSKGVVGSVRVLFRTPGDVWKYASASPIPLPKEMSDAFVTVKFGNSVRGRDVAFEIDGTEGSGGAASRVVSISVADGQEITPVHSNSLKALILADSFGVGSVAHFHGDGFAYQLGWLLDWDVTSSSVGGTGYVRSHIFKNALERIEDLSQQDFDVVLIALGTNDVNEGGVEQAVQKVIEEARRRQPRAPIFVITPWDLEAPGPLAPKKERVREAILDAAGGREAEGIVVLDVTGVQFASDRSHPTTSGHRTLAEWLAGTIINIGK